MNSLSVKNVNIFSVTRNKLLTTTMLTAAGLMAFAQSAKAVDDLTTPTGEQVVGGSATFDRPSDGLLNVNQSTDRVVINWDQFNIGSKAKTEFFQPNSGSLAVNRVTGAGQDPAQILGTLVANGKIMVLDRNGVFFGKNSIVDAQSIIVSTGDASDDELMKAKGKLHLSNFGPGKIQLNGSITVADAGVAAFVSPFVTNAGVINARMGKVAMAGGSMVTLDLYGDDLIEIAVSDKAANALLKNEGQINAQGGEVIVTAQAAKEAVDDVINMGGIVDVSSVEQQGGKIILKGGEQGAITVAGNLNASGKTGGGTIDIDGQNVGLTSGGVLNADGTGDGNGGSVRLFADNETIFNGRIYARGGVNSGDGGNVEVSGLNEIVFNGDVDTTAANGNVGMLLLDPNNVQIIGGNGDGDDNGGAAGAGAIGGYQNTGDNGGTLAYTTPTSNTANPYTIYESEIEAQSATTDITIQARQNITTKTGTGLDNNITLANNRTLTIETENSTADGAGSIDLSNLAFTTQGTGSINVHGSTSGQQVGDVTLGVLNSGAGVTVDTNKGAINFNNTVTSHGNLTAVATGDINFNSAALVQTNGGSVLVNSSAGNVFVDNDIKTGGGSATFAGNSFTTDDTTASGSPDNLDQIVTGGGNIKITADNVALGNTAPINSNVTILDAGAGDVTITRKTAGVITLGDAASAGLNLNKQELSDIHAGTLHIGAPTDADNKVTAIYAQNVDATANISGLVTLTNLLNQDDGVSTILFGGSGVDNNDVIFSGNNKFNALTVNANDHIGAINGSTVKSVTGDITFNADANAQGVGAMVLGGDSLIDTNGHNFTYTGHQALLGGSGAGGAMINAEGGNILLNNDDVFYSYTANTLQTSGAGTITLNQWDKNFTDPTAAWGNHDGSINNAVAALNNSGTGLNTVNVGAGTYDENVLVDQNNAFIRSFDGSATTIVNGQTGGSLGAFLIGNGVNNTQIGDTGHGFTINGFDNGNPGIENAAVYFQGAHDGALIKGNTIVANGDEALLTEYGQTNNNITIDGNAITGNTFTGADGSWGTGDQFSVPNVPRQLVALNFGNSNVTFSNNQVTGNAGDRQLVAIESNGNNTVNNNNFDGLSYASALRVRGTNFNVYYNTIDGNGRGIGIESDKNGVNLTIGSATAADGNIINNTGKDGISIANATGTTNILNNQIGLLGVANSIGSDVGGGDAIFVTNTDGAVIQGNQTANTHYNGPLRKGSGILVTNSDNVQIGGLLAGQANDISLAGSDGIVIRTDGGTIDHDAIQGNTIHGIAGSRTGIYTEGATNVKIDSNIVTGSGRYAAIYVNANGSGHDATITNNTIANNEEEGILVQNNGGVNLIDGNKIDNTGTNVKTSDGSDNGDAIHVQNTAGLTISNNQIGKNGGSIQGDGVYVSGSNGAAIISNAINDTHTKTLDANGSNGSGIQVVNTDGAIIGGALTGNTITNTQWDGVRLQNDSNATVQGNVITNAGRVGIWGGNVNGATIVNNGINGDGLAGYGAIHADGGSNWSVRGNWIDGGDYGIFLNGVGGGQYIDSNYVGYLAGGYSADGIRAVNTSGLMISNNFIGSNSHIGGNAISVIDSAGAQVATNRIENVSGVGIYIDPSPATIVIGNIIAGGVFGVEVTGDSDNSQIKNNTISGQASGGAGIYVNGGSDNALVDGNTITETNPAWGIYVDGGATQTVSNNIINGGYEAISLHNTGAGAQVTGNTVGQTTGTSFNGIELVSTDVATVSGNHVYNAGWDSINVNSNTGAVNVAGNDIHNTAGASGIAFVGGSTAGGAIDNNTIENSARLGIYSDRTQNLTITKNTITNSGTANIMGPAGPFTDGIFIEGGSNVTIGSLTDATKGNTINTATGDGIRVGGGGNYAPVATTGIVIANNKIGLTGGANNIKGNGIEVISSNGVNISKNNVSNVGKNGMLVDPTSDEIIDSNTFSNTGLAGVEVSGDDNVTVTNNTIHDAGTYGIHGTDLTAASGNNKVSGNVIYNTGSNGIDLENVANITVSGNFIGYTDSKSKNPTAGAVHNIHGDGIYVSNATGGKALNSITGNKITQTQFTVADVNGSNGSGIQVVNTNGITIGAAGKNDGNTISGSDWDGIRLQNDNDVDAKNNSIDTVGRVGIYAGNVTNSIIGGSGKNDGNTIKNTARYGGVYAEGGSNLTIQGNEITNSAETGVLMKNAGGTNLVDNNAIDTTGTALKSSDGENSGDGIRIVNAAGAPGAFTTVSNNKVGTNSGANNINGNGISIINSNYAVVNANAVSNTTGNGTFIDPSAHVFITGNTYNNTALNGVDSELNDDVMIDNNTVNNAGINGILVNDAGKTYVSKITNNKISVVGNDGIQQIGGQNAFIDSNKVAGANGGSGFLGTGSANGANGAGRDGIHVENNKNVIVSNNTIAGGNGSNAGSGSGGKGAVNDGIYVKGSDNAQIKTNTVKGGGTIPLIGGPIGNGAGVNGIEVVSSNSTQVLTNTIYQVGHDGILGTNSNSLLIQGNGIGNGIVFGAGWNGIEVSGGKTATIDNNTIKGGLLNAAGAGNDGIHVVNNQSAVITNNKITGGIGVNSNGAVNDGIYVDNSGSLLSGVANLFSNRNGVTIIGNTIGISGLSASAGVDGIFVNNSAGGAAGKAALISDNKVTVTGDDGIEVDNTDGAQITLNDVSLTGDVGILVDPSSNTLTQANTVTLTGSYGIQIISGLSNTVNHNTVSLTGDDGIRLDDNALSKVTNNAISLTKGDGIEVNGGAKVFLLGTVGANLVDNNAISGSGDNGIYVHGASFDKVTNNKVSISVNDGIKGDNADALEVGVNSVTGSGVDGVHITNSDGVNIHDNKVSTSLHDGILLDGSILASIKNNAVSASGADGINANKVTGLTIDTNDVSASLHDGIAASNINAGTIKNNTVKVSGHDGISLVNGNAVGVTSNNVETSLHDGIYVDPSLAIDVSGNTINISGNHGIDINDVIGLTVNDNAVSLSVVDGISLNNIVGGSVGGNNVSLSGANGIDVKNSAGIAVAKNTVAKSLQNGINADGVLGLNIASNGVTISGHDGIALNDVLGGTVDGNAVSVSVNDGISAANSAGIGITGNAVTISLHNGINADDVLGLNVAANTVTISGNDGIALNNVAGGTVNGNDVETSLHDGIDVTNGALIGVKGNVVTGSLVDGIHGEDIAGLNVSDNFVTLAGHDGIGLYNVLDGAIDGNSVSVSGHDGIYVDPSALIDISGNTVTLSLHNGIEADDILGITVNGNNVTISGNDGIALSNVIGGTVNGNTVATSLRDGIHANTVGGLLIAGNAVTLSGRDGIHANHTIGLDITGNLVTLSGNDGIDINHSLLTNVSQNVVLGSLNNGIEVNNAPFANINQNIVAFSGHDGISVNNSFGGDVDDNLVVFAGRDGIRVRTSGFAEVDGNNVAFAGRDGIRVRGSDNVEINHNNVAFAGNDGIHLIHSKNSQIVDNDVNFVGDNGIDVRNGNTINISGNTATHAGNAGIFVDPSKNILVSGNDVYGNNVGIQFVDVTNSEISGGNNVHDNLTVGILLDHVHQVHILNNNIFDNGKIGLFAEGGHNGYIELSGNVFTDNPIGAEFQSGLIDLAGNAINLNPGNHFIGGDVALLFDPGKGGNPHHLKLIDDDGAGGYGGTIGAQIFDNQSTYYVELANGAFFDPGTPTHLDGLFSTYDGITPGPSGILTQAQYDAINAKIFDFRDDNTLGLFFFGFVPTADITDPSKFFNQFGGFNGHTAGLSITLLGLPGVPGGGGGFSPQGLNGIQTFAGGDGNTGSNAPMSAAELNSIESAAGDGAAGNPAPGGQQSKGKSQAANCWNDAMSAAYGGHAVTYSFGTSAEEGLASASACSAGASF